MADKYLLEEAAGVYSYQLEDASGDYLLENQAPASGSVGGRWRVVVLPRRPGPPLFLHNDELGTVAQTTIVEEDGWWTGRLQGYGSPLVIPGPIFPPVTDDDVLPRFILVDEEGQLVVAQKPLIVSIQALFGNDDTVPQPAGAIFDEDVWNVAKPQARGPLILAQPPSGGLAGTPPAPATLSVDDEPWQVYAQKPLAASVKAIFDTDEFKFTPAGTIGVDEETWSWNYRKPAVKIFSMPLSGALAGTPPAAAPFGVDEDYWWNNAYSAYGRVVTAFIDIGETPVQVDEDFSLYLVSGIYSVPGQQAYASTDELNFTPATPINVDEDYWWHSGFTGYTVPVQALSTTDEIGTPIVPINVDEEYWWTNQYQVIQYRPAITDDEIGTQLIAPPEPPTPTPEPGPPSFGGPPWYYRYGKHHRRGCDEEDEECYERAEEFLEELGDEEKLKLEKLVQKAVIAVKEDKPAQFKAAQRMFTAEVAKVSGIVKADIAAIWRVEIEHRIMEEEEEMTILLAYF